MNQKTFEDWLNKEFTGWLNKDIEAENPYQNNSASYWAWEGWMAGRKAEQDRCAKIADAHATIEGIAQTIAAEIRSDK